MKSPLPRVLVFDSGVGGLSILREVREKLPACNYIYACDNRAFPYGTKSEAELVARVDLVLKALIGAIDPDIVVIACNTASTVALPKIRSHFLKPVVGVVPAIKPAAQLSRTRTIGVLATAGTVNRPYTQWLIDEFAADCTVERLGSAQLVEMAEAKLRGRAPDPDAVKAVIAPLFENPALDVVVLACTHFPLLREELTAAAPRAVHWVDSGEAIARRVSSFVGGNADAGPAGSDNGFDCWLTQRDGTTAALIDGLRSFGAGEIRSLEL